MMGACDGSSACGVSGRNWGCGNLFIGCWSGNGGFLVCKEKVDLWRERVNCMIVGRKIYWRL